MKIIKSFNEWCDEALQLLKNSTFCYISSYNLNYTEGLNDKVYEILQQAIDIEHKIIIGVGNQQCIPNCPHCITNNTIKHQNINRLQTLTSNYRIVQELHMKSFITSNGIIVGGMNITGSGWTDRAFSLDKSHVDEMKNDYEIVYHSAKTYEIQNYIDPNKYFTFGKYKGQLIENVKKNNPQYIDWLIKNTQFKEPIIS